MDSIENEVAGAVGAHMAEHLAAMQAFLLPVLALAAWTLVMWLWMYATRIPAMQKAKIDPDTARHPGGAYNDLIPSNVRAIADNYNHLHEQPTVFYAVMFFAAMTGGGDNLATMLAWAYVALRVVHSLVQSLSATVPLRFVVFSLSSIVLIVLVAKEVLRSVF